MELANTVLTLDKTSPTAEREQGDVTRDVEQGSRLGRTRSGSSGWSFRKEKEYQDVALELTTFSHYWSLDLACVLDDKNW